MAKLIALRSGFIDRVFSTWQSSLASNLKQHALLFDQIGIFGLSQIYKVADSSMNDPDFPSGFLKYKLEPIIMELQWLTEKGIIFELTTEGEFREQVVNDYFSKVDSRYSVEEVLRLSSILVTAGEVVVNNAENKADLVNLLKAIDVITLRLMALMIETTKGVRAVTTLPYTEYVRDLPKSNKSNVAQIVISKLPMPDNETPWEQIIDYRNDPETQKHLFSLRRWISEISTQNLSSLEIEEEIESLINDFQEHMKFHKIKANTETLEVIVKLLPETIENLIKLKFSKLHEPFFAFKKRQINLMEAELNAPGKEMAYIIKTQETF